MKFILTCRANFLYVFVLSLFLPDITVSASPQKPTPTQPKTGVERNFSLTSETIVRFFERDTTKENNADVFPVYEYLQMDYGKNTTGGFSFHGYGWGRIDLADSDFYTDETEGELLYGYVQYALPLNNLNIKLGRQHIFEAVANESIDGLRVQTDFTPYFRITAYGGLPISLDDHEGSSGDSIYGGRLSHHLKSIYNIGLSYKQIVSDSHQDEERLGIDFSLSLPKGSGLDGFSNFNLITNDWGEHSYEGRLTLLGLNVRPYFQRFQYEDYFSTNDNSSNLFRFLAGTQEVLTIYGGDLALQRGANWDFGLKIKSLNYDIRNDSAGYYAALVTWHGKGLTQIGGEFGNMDGDTPETDYLLTRIYFYREQLPAALQKAFLSGDLIYVYYNRDIFGEDTSLFLSLGSGLKFFDDDLEVKLSGDYSADPYFDEDFRAMLAIKYKFN